LDLLELVNLWAASFGGEKYFQSSPLSRESQGLFVIKGNSAGFYQRRGASFTHRMVSRAISNSSFVGMTNTLIRPPFFPISPSVPLVIVLFCFSNVDPHIIQDRQMRQRKFLKENYMCGKEGHWMILARDVSVASSDFGIPFWPREESALIAEYQKIAHNPRVIKHRMEFKHV